MSGSLLYIFYISRTKANRAGKPYMCIVLCLCYIHKCINRVFFSTFINKCINNLQSSATNIFRLMSKLKYQRKAIENIKAITEQN